MSKKSMMDQMTNLLDDGGAAMLVYMVFAKYPKGTIITMKYLTQRAWEAAMEVVNDRQAKFLRTVEGEFCIQMSIDRYIHAHCTDNPHYNKTVRKIVGKCGGIELI